MVNTVRFIEMIHKWFGNTLILCTLSYKHKLKKKRILAQIQITNIDAFVSWSKSQLMCNSVHFCIQASFYILFF